MVDPEDFDTMKDPEFRAELDRRIASVAEGSMKMIDGDEAFELAKLDLERWRWRAERAR